MSPDPYLETPHHRHPSGGTFSSDEYEAGEESPASSMDNHATPGYKKPMPLGYAGQQPSKSSSNHKLSAFVTPSQTSPQSMRAGMVVQNDREAGSYHDNSGSEEDHEQQFSSREPALLGDLSRTTAYRARRDSGLPPIKMTAAKRLPPFNASLSSIPAESLVEEEEEEEEEEEVQSLSSRGDHEGEIGAIPSGEDQMQTRIRDMDARQANNQSRNMENGGSKSSMAGVLSQKSSFHPFPSPPVRTSQSAANASKPGSSLSSGSSTKGNMPQQKLNGNNTPIVRPQEPDRGPADLSNPSMALAEALIAARAEARNKEQQQSSLSSTPSNQSRTNGQNFGYRENGRRQGSSAAPESNGHGSTGQIRIPVPDLSPTLRGYPSQSGRQLDLGRNPDALLYNRRTSFTLSPTSSNPELAESQTDSHSGSYVTPRPNINGGTTMLPPMSAKYSNGGNRPVGPSISSSYSRYSDDYNQQPQQHRSQHHRESSLLGTSYDSAMSGQQDGGMYSRFAFPRHDLDQSSLPSQSYTESIHHPSGYPQGQSGESSNFQREYTNHRRFRSSMDSDSQQYAGSHDKAANTSFQKVHQHEQHQKGRSNPTGSASAYPHTTSSHSLGISEDLQDQMNTEAEYIMNRNTELLRILSIRDEEIQTLQQELDHTLKVMHEYEDDLMTMHTAAAKPYESYHQTLDQIGHEMTQQDALLKGYQQENEKLASQLKSSVELRQEAEKRHLRTMDQLKNELSLLRAELENSDQEKYGTTDLRVLLKHSQENHERARKGFQDKEEEYQAEISELKERLKLTEQLVEDERRAKVEDMQKLERDIQDFRAGYDSMLTQLQSLGPGYRLLNPHPKRGSSSSSQDDGQADTTVDAELERDIGLIEESLMKGSNKSSTNTSSSSPSPPLSVDQRQKDRKLTSTETLTAASMPDNTDPEKIDLEQRISKFEADVRQSLLRSASIESFISVRSSTGTVIPLASRVKPQQDRHGSSRDDLRLPAMSEGHKLANKLRDRINTLNVENKRLHTELSSISHVLRQQQAERQRKVAQLEELLDMHENMANQKLDDANTEEGQARIRKVIQGLLVRIRTKEAEAEFYHNAYLDKVLELDQMALANGKTLAVEAHAEERQSQAMVESLSIASPSPSSSVIEALEARVKELERINMETAFRLAAEQRRAQATETENATLIREKLTLARMLEDQVDQLQSKLSAVEIARARLEDENKTLRQQGSKDQQQRRFSQDDRAQGQQEAANDSTNIESMAIMRTRMLSLTRQRDQLREQLQEAFDIQLQMQDRSGGGVPEWSVDDFKRLERTLEEKASELGIWKERAIALEKVVERIRMIKDKPDPTGLDRSLTQDSDTASSVSGSGSRQQHHTLEELDQVVLRLEQRLERRDQELQEVVLEAKRQTDRRLEAWKSKWVQVVQRKNAEIHRFQVELESLMAAVDRDRARMAASLKK
ncbi:hypothetical protein BGZ50_005681 [Haplosporangium sp. Z 11]|nr:hypothetical protein BGZ50_005681 [Haplosporangium sp. Z 11]